MARHMLDSLAGSARMTLHVSAEGRDPHHVAEAAFKAVGRALREATRIGETAELPSTKGVL
jgi:imidazoleglycerol phosphate dehydratase HisB